MRDKQPKLIFHHFSVSEKFSDRQIFESLKQWKGSFGNVDRCTHKRRNTLANSLQSTSHDQPFTTLKLQTRCTAIWIDIELANLLIMSH